MALKLTGLHFSKLPNLKTTFVSLTDGDIKQVQFVLGGSSDDHRKMTIEDLERLALEENARN